MNLCLQKIDNNLASIPKVDFIFPVIESAIKGVCLLLWVSPAAYHTTPTDVPWNYFLFSDDLAHELGVTSDSLFHVWLLHLQACGYQWGLGVQGGLLTCPVPWQNWLGYSNSCVPAVRPLLLACPSTAKDQTCHCCSILKQSTSSRYNSCGPCYPALRLACVRVLTRLLLNHCVK